MRNLLIAFCVLGVASGIAMQLAAVGFLGWLGEKVDEADRKSSLNTAGRIIAVVGVVLAWGALQWA